MKKRTIAIALLPLLMSCVSRAIEPIASDPIPQRKYPLSVWYVTPSYGGVIGEEIPLDIAGTGFEPECQVFVGEHECARLEYKSDSSLKCYQPMSINKAGHYRVTVVNPDGTKRPLPPEEFLKAFPDYQDDEEEDDTPGEEGQILYFVRESMKK